METSDEFHREGNPDGALLAPLDRREPMTEKTAILYNSPEAAAIQSVTGWVSRHGRYFGQDENAARWDGCTHRKCATEGCETILCREDFTICQSCRDKRDADHYGMLERGPWDGIAMLYSGSADVYFSTISEAEDHADANGISLEDLRLVICEPVFLHELDTEGWVDDLPEDGELPSEVRSALNALNKVSTSRS